MTDRPSLAKPVPVPASRVARLTRLGAMTAGVAGNMAVNGVAQLGRGQRPSMRNLLLTPNNVTRITDQLAQMRGAAMKVGQLMSMDTGDVLSPELAGILGRLRADAHFMPPPQLKKVLTQNWGPNWLKAFKSFNVRPVAAASIGQVHRAQLKDSRDLAIKVQYPGIAKSIDSDVTNVGALIKMTGLLPSGFELQPYLEEARKQLHEETDYILEGHHLAHFGELLKDNPRFQLPQLHDDWTTPDILAMSYVHGEPIEAAAEAAQTDRNRIAKDLIDLMLIELFDFGLMQTDPNFANYRYNRETGRIVLLDFGATRRIDPIITDQYRRLFVAGLAGDTGVLNQMLGEIGFVAPNTDPSHLARLQKMIGMVFDALRETPIFDFGQTDLPARLQVEGAALAEAGFVPPPLPMDVLYLQRKFGGIFLLAARLKACVAVTELMAPHVSKK